MPKKKKGGGPKASMSLGDLQVEVDANGEVNLYSR